MPKVKFYLLASGECLGSLAYFMFMIPRKGETVEIPNSQGEYTSYDVLSINYQLRRKHNSEADVHVIVTHSEWRNL